MKIFNCYDCNESFRAVSKDAILILLYKHYMEHHKEIISKNSEAGKLTWMDTFDKDWLAAVEISV